MALTNVHEVTSSNTTMSSPSPSTNPPSTSRHALTAVEKQRAQLDKLLKDPSKPVYVPPPPKEKTIRAAREMMKNVQGSSAGAGSGEFHVYKASRRREYERLKLMDEQTQKEALTFEFEQKRKQAEDVAEVKTAKNRAKRQKKKERAKQNRSKAEGDSKQDGASRESEHADLPLKKRRLVNGKELVFRKPGEESDSGSDEDPQPHEVPEVQVPLGAPEILAPVSTAEEAKITIHEDD